MNIAIIGSGYVGLVTGTCFAELGNTVICVDNNSEKIAMLSNGIVPIYEPGLSEMITNSVKRGRLMFTTSIKNAVASSDIIFICVGTPPKESGEADLSYVENVSKEIARHIDKYKLIVEKSTVPVETGEKVAKTIKSNQIANIEFDVASNPEFLREGTAIADFMNPDRIVIGVESEKSEQILRELYAPLKAPIVVTDIKSAEIIKHASNSFLAAKISFINAVANICELTGANVEKVAEGMGYDKRIGRSFLNAGLGYGGSCFPKDVSAFCSISRKLGYDFTLLDTVQEINEKQMRIFLKKVEDALWNLKSKKICVLGLSFKPNTDDLREAPSIRVISALQKEGAIIHAYDPKAMEKLNEIFPDVKIANNSYEAAQDSDAVLILTEWNEFKEIDLVRLKRLMKRPLIIDGRNIYDPEKMNELGFEYISMGR